MNASIHVLRPGRHGGRQWPAAVLREIADSYDAELHEAPIVVGHPATNDPAYGWIGSLRVDSDGLHAVPSEIDPELAEMVAGGKFRKVSVALYGPDSPRNPTPGKWHLRHVGFLGAAPPVVKGLKPVELGEVAAGDVVVELADPNMRSIVELFRQLRDWLIDRTSLEEADQVLPSWRLDHLQQEASDQPTMAEEDPMPTHDPAPEAHPDEAALAERERKVQEREAAAARAEARREALEFAETAVREGRVPPRERDALADVLAAIPDEAEVELAEGAKAPARQALRDLVGRLPRQIVYGETAAPEAPGETLVIDLPPGWTSADSALHSAAVEYAERNDVDYETAVLAVGRAA